MLSKFIVSLFCSLLFLSWGNAQSYVVSNHNPRIVESYYGIVVDKRWVEYGSYAGNNEGVGTVAGAITGGAVGAAFGGGSGKIATVLGGSVLGGFLGNSIGKSSTKYNKYHMIEYTLRTNDGQLMTVMQTPNINLALGQRVLLERSNDGRWFFLPY